ncbi:carboxymuconolactone decarboxylase family protein [Anaerobacillus isosaccharinicus]|uniref:Carboxymuconolactone decarboxylase family protein n=1 Tax=Anaerobacillus isosaccharinicus TaxID=1532552 RepID=A0A1S2L442_9BACI|nr:carboxymuconolactone decarboxylase family protein [Anaerobacillus isosaccharinicus]MBA5584499.1 carboxymuconolactone decarboxylase family protein [Anaerobacillus isosaccharinicus]QOY37117.1 carboxymuconolactone decarboxylase family protein [Anaerobacillus isosaccharinicus]
MDRYDSGLENFKNICGENAINSLEELKAISPELASMVIEFAYGDLHTLTNLTHREKEIISITSLITQGEINSALELHYKAALNIGITSKEIKDLIVHSVAYIGFPKAIKAMMLLKEVLVKI